MNKPQDIGPCIKHQTLECNRGPDCWQVIRRWCFSQRETETAQFLVDLTAHVKKLITKVG